MSSMSMGDMTFATKLRTLVMQLAGEAIDKMRPRPRYGVVYTIDRPGKRAQVILNGDLDPVSVSLGAIQPKMAGQVVRVEGIGFDKYVTDVVGGVIYWGNVEISASQVTSGIFHPARMAHVNSDSSTRTWFTTDPSGGWGGAHTTLAMSPPTDTAWAEKFVVRVNNVTKFALDADGKMTAGIVPAELIDKMTSAADHTNLMGTANSVQYGMVFQLNDAAKVAGLIYDNAWKVQWNHLGVMTVGTVPYARLEDPTQLAGSGSNLNSYATTGVWHQSANSGASSGSNYPAALAGLLEVVVSGAFVYQRYTTYAYGASTGDDPRNARVYTRGRYNGAWSTWQPISKQGHAAGRVGIQVTTANTIGSAYVSFPTGRFNAGAPAVTATCHSGAANGRMVTISDPSTSGVTIYLWAHAVVSNSVSWIAQEWG